MTVADSTHSMIETAIYLSVFANGTLDSAVTSWVTAWLRMYHSFIVILHMYLIRSSFWKIALWRRLDETRVTNHGLGSPWTCCSNGRVVNKALVLKFSYKMANRFGSTSPKYWTWISCHALALYLECYCTVRSGRSHVKFQVLCLPRPLNVCGGVKWVLRTQPIFIFLDFTHSSRWFVLPG